MPGAHKPPAALYAFRMPTSPHRARRIAVATALGTAALASPALARWAAPSGAPLNAAANQPASSAAIAAVGGVPYAAWREPDGTNNEIRVSRLVPAGWEAVGAARVPSSPVNNDSLGDARSAAIADVNGVPFVAWTEFDGTNTEVRVARPSADGQGWDRVGQASPASSPINASPSRNAGAADVANVNGVPYVTWAEDDGTNTQVRVARLRADGVAWERVGEGADANGPVNRVNGRNAFEPTIAAINGVPYVAWAEADAKKVTQIRVARLNAAGNGWQPVGETRDPASPINNTKTTSARAPHIVNWNNRPAVVWVEDVAGGARRVHAAIMSTAGTGWESLDGGRGLNANPRRPATAPSAAVIAGQLWATWAESDGTNREVRAARATAPGGRWQQMAPGASPVNASATRNADAPDITDVTGMPYVAWTEDAGAATQVRAARMEPDFTRLSASAVEERVNLSATLRTFSMPYQVGFQISGGGIARETRPGAVSGDPATATAVASALRSGVGYQWRPFVVAGAGGLVAAGPSQAITTTSVARLVLSTPGAKKGRTWRFRAGRLMGIRVRTNLRGRLTVVVAGRGVVRRVTRLARAGNTPVRIRLPRRVGVYRVTVTVKASGGRTATVRGRLTMVPARRW